MTNELLNEWKKEKIVEDGDIVLAGVSGGADSVCLLLMLEQLQKKTDFLLEAVHVEHGISGEESRKDAAFVKTLCQDHGIRFQWKFLYLRRNMVLGWRKQRAF